MSAHHKNILPGSLERMQILVSKEAGRKITEESWKLGITRIKMVDKMVEVYFDIFEKHSSYTVLKKGRKHERLC